MAKPIDVIKKGGTEDKTKTGEVLVEKKVVPYQAQYYRGFGNEGEDAYKSGWVYEKDPINGKDIYTNQYGSAFNKILIPNDNRPGHLAIVSAGNGKFDVIVRNADKKQQGQPLRGNLTYNQVQQMYGNQLIGNRMNQVLKEDAKQPTNPSMAIFK